MRFGLQIATVAMAAVALPALSLAQSFQQARTPGVAPHQTAAETPTDFRTGIFRGQAVNYGIVGNKAVMGGDILLDRVSALPTADDARASGRVPNAVGNAYPQYFWPKNGSGVAQIPYIVTNGNAALSTALTRFNTDFAGIIQFVPRTAEADYVNFNLDSNNHNGTCESYVGRVGGVQPVGGSIDCVVGTLLHEMGHVVGLFHEQSRPDRASYVTILLQNMIRGSQGNFDQLIDGYQDLGFYDYASVMHYIPWAFSRNGGPTIESIPAGMLLSNVNDYTSADLDAVKRLYGGTPNTVTIDSNPSGLSVTVDGANVTTPHVFNWALNSSHTLAVGTNAQTLSGTTYVFGRWNDDVKNTLGASHTIKVKAGTGTLAQPKNRPAKIGRAHV